MLGKKLKILKSMKKLKLKLELDVAKNKENKSTASLVTEAIVRVAPRGGNHCFVSMQITRPQLSELTEVIEDTVEYYCDQNTLSGELVWTAVGCLAEAKLAEMRGEVTA